MMLYTSVFLRRALDRFQTLYIFRNLAKSCVFVKQSLFSFFCHLLFIGISSPSFVSYDINLQSSFITIIFFFSLSLLDQFTSVGIRYGKILFFLAQENFVYHFELPIKTVFILLPSQLFLRDRRNFSVVKIKP